MTATLIPTAPAATARSTRSLATVGGAATAVASLATTAVAAAGTAGGISLDEAGAPIPLPGFATLTAACSLVGLLVAVALSRWARRPRRTFVATAVVLTALSLLPDLVAEPPGPPGRCSR